MRLTDVSIRALPAPEKGQKAYFCETLPGFGVRVSQGGTKTFVLVCGKHRTRLKLGRYPIVTLAQAREKAKNLLAQRQLNGDKEPEPEAMTLEAAVKLFLTIRCAEKNKASTAKETGRLLNRHFLPTLKSKAITEITTGDLLEITDALLEAGTKSEANHAFTAARTLCRWLTRRRYIPHSPLEGAEMPAKAVSRHRVLSPPELRLALLTAPSQGSYGLMIECIVLSAQRDGQFAHLHRDFINPTEKTITWPGSLMKSNREHVLPYTDRIGRILDTRPSPLLFPGDTNPRKPFSNWSNCKERFDKACPIPHWVLHDLRRAFSTHAATFAPPHVVDLILDHSPIELSGVRGIYNKHRYISEMRSALLQYQNWLDSLS